MQSVLVLWEIDPLAAYAPSFFFMGIVAAMAYEMSREYNGPRNCRKNSARAKRD